MKKVIIAIVGVVAIVGIYKLVKKTTAPAASNEDLLKPAVEPTKRNLSDPKIIREVINAMPPAQGPSTNLNSGSGLQLGFDGYKNCCGSSSFAGYKE